MKNPITSAEFDKMITEVEILEDGWFDNSGLKIDPKLIQRMRKLKTLLLAQGLPLPYLYPVSVGGSVLLESDGWNGRLWLSIELFGETEEDEDYWHLMNMDEENNESIDGHLVGQNPDFVICELMQDIFNKELPWETILNRKYQ